MSKLYIVRFFAALIQIVVAAYFFLIGKHYSGLKALCWSYRVPDIFFFKKKLLPVFVYIAKRCYKSDQNPILTSFLKTSYSKQIRRKYSLSSNEGKLYLLRDMLILSQQDGPQKGVVILKYGESFDAVCTLFNMDKLLQNYVLVLETSWSGACDPTFFMFIKKAHPVIVEFPECEDCQFIASLKTNLVPWQKGSGDWLEKRIVPQNTPKEKIYDIIMVANWAKFKNHKILFNAIHKIKNKKLKVLLIGFPFNGRIKEDIQKEYDNEVGKNSDCELTILENVSANNVLYYLSVSKVFVLLTRKEGSNRALSESFAVGTPAIVYKFIKGGAAERINNNTGILSDFHELDAKIVYMLENYTKYSPKEYILNQSNSHDSTKELTQLLQKCCTEYDLKCKFGIVEKTNAPNLEYVDVLNRDVFKEDYKKLIQLSR